MAQGSGSIDTAVVVFFGACRDFFAGRCAERACGLGFFDGFFDDTLLFAAGDFFA